MSDVLEAPQSASEALGEGAPGFGRRLAEERERKGLSIDDIAARLRLNPRQVQAIESESLPPLPAPFLRGFVRNYAKELKLDPAPLLAELDARLAPPPGEPAVEDKAPSGARFPLGEHFSGRFVLIGAIVVLVALAFIGWIATRMQERDAGQVALSPAPVVAEVSVPAAGGSQGAEEAVPANAAPVAEAPNATPPPVPKPAELLHLVFREQSWVEVTQADGRIVHSQINEAGTEQRIDGRPPLRLVIGNASAVLVEYKGAAVDLKPVTSVDNVARITLN